MAAKERRDTTPEEASAKHALVAVPLFLASPQGHPSFSSGDTFFMHYCCTSTLPITNCMFIYLLVLMH